MLDKKDYFNLSSDELLAEEKKIKKQEITAAIFVGALFGVMIYGVVMNGFGFLYIAIPLFLIATVAKNSQLQKEKLKKIQAEIEDKKAM